MHPHLFGDQVYEEIRSTWNWARSRPNADPAGEPPDIATLATFIDPIFRTSIQREEGRDLQISVVRMAPVPAAPGQIFVLKEPLGYFDRNLKKIATALDPRCSALLVHQAPDQAQPQIWGFGYFGTNHLGHLNVGTGYESGWPRELIIRSTGPGLLSIARGDGNLGVIEFGSFIWPIPSPTTSTAMGNRLIDLIRNDPGHAKLGVHYWHQFRNTLEQLLRRINRVGHGATLILVSAAHQAELTGRYHGGFTAQGSFQVAELLQRRMSLPSDIQVAPLSAALGNRLDERIEGIAKLACIDGALLVTSELEVIAFGAKLNAPPWTGPVIVGPDGFKSNGQAFDLARHGTRHGSAAALVGSCQHVIAFVCSADGPIRGLAHDNASGKLVCWPDFRASMFTRDAI